MATLYSLTEINNSPPQDQNLKSQMLLDDYQNLNTKFALHNPLAHEYYI